ncbi:hypothetical protein [Amycolatopsis sp. NPDC051903]|uniref:hypothetical protein n=1 Tax=Amycolatopsis sp. NPDC051903 TaxID=3363936 RepID=UPI00379B23E3
MPTPETTLATIPTPTLVLVGAADGAHATAAALAAALPHAEFLRVPGDHFTALGSPEFAAAVGAFLA